MTCADFELLLDEQFGPAALRDDPALAEHAAACGACRAQWDRHRVLADAIGAWRTQAPEVDLTAAVLAGLEPQFMPSELRPVAFQAAAMPAPRPGLVTASRPSSQTVATRPVIGRGLGRSRRSLVAAALALTALIAVLSQTPWLRDFSQPAHSIAVKSWQPAGSFPPANTATAGRQEQPNQQQPNSTTGRANTVRPEDLVSYSGLAQLAAVAWDEVTLLVRPESSGTEPPNHARQPAGTNDGWIDGLQHQLKPIGKGLDNAFDFLWQAGQSGDG